MENSALLQARAVVLLKKFVFRGGMRLQYLLYHWPLPLRKDTAPDYVSAGTVSSIENSGDFLPQSSAPCVY